MKILCSDYDGTFTNTPVDEKKLEAVAEWRREGNLFGFVTGRPYPHIMYEIDRHTIPFDFIIGNNGAFIVFPDRETVSARRNPPELLRPLAEEVKKLGALWGVLSADFTAEYYITDDVHKRHPDWQYVDDVIKKAKYFTQFTAVFEDNTSASAAIEVITEKMGDYLNPIQNYNCLDVVMRGVDKAQGIRDLLKLIGGKEEDVIAVGDSENDFAMMGAFRSYTVESARDNVKEFADSVCFDITDLMKKESVKDRKMKIQMKTPLVEMDGDEMTRIIWKMIKEKLLLPYVDLKTVYFDLGLENRNKTSDEVTVESAEATKKYGVAVKCATITPNKARMSEYNLSQMWKSPNGTIRAILGGTIFRAPILTESIKPYIPAWKKPITIARHAYGDIYRNTEMAVPKGSKCELVCTSPDGKETRMLIHDYSESDGIAQGIHNLDSSISDFARCCFNYALETSQDLWFSAKDTISKTYDHRFKDIFADIYENEYRSRFEEKGIAYYYTLIDDAVARVIRSEGGFIWACKNYDGDVMSDMVSTAYGSLAMMTSVLVSPDGKYEYEAAHGTVQRHYYKYLEGKPTSTNSVATIFAWTGALRKRAELDGISDLARFADDLEKATLETVESGVMTGDLASVSSLENAKSVTTEEFLDAIASNLAKRYA